MSRKRSVPSRDVSRRAKHEPISFVAGTPVWLPPMAATIVTARFFLPAESAHLGETLWIVILWIVCAMLWLLDVYRNGERFRRPDAMSLGIALLVGGHVLSALRVLVTEGEKRAALNMLWEWVGIGIAALVLRQVLRSLPGRGQLMMTIVISGMVLSGLGLWQHYVWYPRIASQMEELTALDVKLESEPPSSASERRELTRRRNALRRELGWPPHSSESSNRMFRDRVQASTEPIGRFALANSLAGLLLVSLCLGAGGLILAVRNGGRGASVVGLVIGLLLIGYCLWLTKSRTAWVGLIGAVCVGTLSLRRAAAGGNVTRWVIIAGAIVLVGMPIAATLSGSLDREVLSEAPKSLLYRLEYWTATAHLIADHWLTGIGPGNFRQHYLQYKLPGSSEEILDPHNFVLDVWANGGLLALAGLIILSGAVARCFIRRTAADLPRTEGLPDRPASRLIGVIGTVAFAIAALAELFGGTSPGSQWWALLGGWWVATLAVSARATFGNQQVVPLAALTGLLIHLTGAGGIAMPAITQIVLILLFAVIEEPGPKSSGKTLDDVRAEPPPVHRSGNLTVGAAAIACMALAIGCAVTATLPVTQSHAALAIGQSIWQTEGQIASATRFFEQAASDDPFAPDPWQELAGISYARWLQTSEESDFEKAVSAQQEAILRDPQNSNRWAVLGQLWSERLQRQPDHEAARQAADALARAAELYPHSADAQAASAIAARDAGETQQASQAAQAALELDELNRSRGHVDKYLADSQLAELRDIAAGARNTDTGE